MSETQTARQEWLEWRKRGIGASDVAGILSLSPWSSPWSVWASKVLDLPDDDATEQQEMGLALEPTISRLFHTRTGLYVVGAQKRCHHPEVPWALATLDGLVAEHPATSVDLTATLGNFEAKTTSQSPAQWEEAIPVYYSAQVQWQMWVTGAERTWLGVLHASFGLKFRVYEVERDESDIRFIVDRVTEFYEKHIATGEPPATDGTPGTTRALNLLPVDAGQVVDLSSQAFTVERLRRVRADIAALEATEGELVNELKGAMGEATEAEVDGEPVATWREQTRTGIDSKGLRADYPEIAKLYETTTKSRVFRLAKPKEK